jgi:CheY-like chemotaxis protein
VPIEEASSERRDGVPGRRATFSPSAEPIRDTPREVADDREKIREGDRVLLIIEDDEKFARILVNMAGENGFKAVVATRGDTGIAMANEFQPDAITLDVHLPVIDGLSVFDHLKRNPRTRQIPVHVITIAEKSDGSTRGAFAYLEKPVNKEALDKAFARLSRYLDHGVRRLLVVEADANELGRLVDLLGEDKGVDVVAVGSTDEAERVLDSEPFDCLVLGLGADDHDKGLRLAEHVKTQPQFEQLPIVVCTAKALTVSEQQRARSCVESVNVRSGEEWPIQVLRDAYLFLHRVVPGSLSQTPTGIGEVVPAKKVLVVDDDVRNVFAVSSALEGKGLSVIYAENGKRALDVLRTTPDIAVVLMDIMMPEMDGFEAIKTIRSELPYKSTPVIAVTAKALKEDRERCIRAGASDYLPKPIDTSKLLDMIGIWMQ